MVLIRLWCNEVDQISMVWPHSFYSSFRKQDVKAQSKGMYDASYWPNIISQQVAQNCRRRVDITSCCINANHFVTNDVTIF